MSSLYVIISPALNHRHHSVSDTTPLVNYRNTRDDETTESRDTNTCLHIYRFIAHLNIFHKTVWFFKIHNNYERASECAF